MRTTRNLVIALVVGLITVAGACSNDGAEKVSTNSGAAGLAEAFSDSADATSYRVTQFNGQDVELEPLGIDQKTEIDLDRPALVGEVSADRTHMKIDMGAMLGAFGPGTDSLYMEMWVDDQRAVIDTRSFAPFKEQNPGASLGPMEPGVAYIDLSEVAASSPDLVTALIGSGLVDLNALAERLPESLEDVEQDDDGNYHGETDYATVVEAMGGNIDDVARGASAGLALNLQVDAARLAAFYADVYRSSPSEVVVEIEDGAVSAIAVEADLSAVFDDLFTPESELFDGFSDAEMAEAADAFAGGRMVLSMRVEFEVDPELQVPSAPATDDDRTKEWVDLIKSAM